MFNNKFFTSAIVAAAAVTGVLAQATSAAAFDWDNNWQQPEIFSGQSQGFDHTQFQQFVQAEGLAVQNSGQKQIDASNLFLKYDHNVKVSFVNEGAGYRNQLGFETTGTTSGTGALFTDIACSGAGCQGDWGGNTLNLGDTVKMGTVKGGTQLDFFLRGNGYNWGDNAYTYGTQSADNPDGLQHVVSYTYGDRYLVLGFEDLYGDGTSKQGKFNKKSDRDFNDTVFVVDIGEANVRYLNGEDVPEPAAAAALIGVGGAAWMKRRKKAAN
ncbi:DUF4114 domain-containing protein [filamentous cyanobacterium LEGE 11480]|uniref:DUF4114 domain-containing protein n=1 Tax=Romeriopsis navalis LEGE 11480 TaxID=2777977 RepID=A0A928VIV3_9CYAN|nr:DUF4114 domain-containing protein [Romeriopsis navalis]MBE9029145.1 DUF4114 domain-containing protein [Romeriopsis navalis LEGE 11480]